MNSKNSKFLRRLIISYSILLIVILIMGVYLYDITIDNVSNEIIAQNQISLQKTVGDLDASFRTMDVLASQVISNSNIVNLAYSEDNTKKEFILQAYHAKEELAVYGFTESILPVKNYFIYLKKPGYALSSTQFTETELYYYGKNSFYRDMYEDWMALLNNDERYKEFIPLDPFKTYIDQTYFYMLPLTEYTLKRVPATLCFEMDFERLENNFKEINLYDTGYIYVTNSDDEFAFSIKGNEVNILDRDTLLNLEYTDGSAFFTSSATEMLVTKNSSKYNEWHYYLVQPKNEALYSLNTYRNIFIAIILIGLLIEVIVITYLSRSNVKKITQLGTELQDTLTLQQSLQEVVETQKPLIMQSYLSKILKGNIATQEEVNYAQQYLSIDISEKKFSILYMISYINQYEVYVENSAVTVPEDMNYKDIIQSALNRFFPEDAYIFRNKEGEYAILLSSNESENIETSNASVNEAFARCHEYLKTKYSIWTFAGLGGWNTGLMITWKSYQEATKAVSYATKRHIFHCYAKMEKDNAGFYYPLELTKQLTTFVNSGNDSQVLEIFEILRHENMEERSLPIDMMKYLLSDVRNTLYKIRFTIKSTEKNMSKLENIDTLFNKHMSLKLCEDIALKLCKLFDANACGNKQIDTIRQYIDDNYKDPSLCLTKISDEFSISESYFSFLFKEEIGENFSSYLSRTRIEQAHELLKSSDINVSDIYLEVGYNNSHSFRRAFKKFYGLSPKEARFQSRSA